MGNGTIRYLKYIFDCVLNLIYDDHGNCIICGNSLEENYICTTCSDKINDKEVKHNIGKENLTIECISAGYYSGIMKELILRLKYKSDFKSGKVLAEIMHKVIVRNRISYDIITYVPSSKNALKKRGFNQAEYIAHLIGEKENKRVLRCITKHKETKDQIGLGGIDRWLNLKESFIIHKKSDIKNTTILLIDDVITTGATTFYCGELLLKEGCGKVIILTAAKSTI